MRLQTSRTSLRALTRFELLVVVFISLILLTIIAGGVLRPKRPSRSDNRQMICLNNQKTVAIAFALFREDHEGHFPWEVSTNDQGSLELAGLPTTAVHYRGLAGSAGGLKHLICPFETTRYASTNWANLTDSNVSYFIHLTANTGYSNSLLVGDRHWAVNGKPVNPGIQSDVSSANVTWTRTLHGATPAGILTFVDGSAGLTKEYWTNRFTFLLPQTNRFVIP